MRMVIGFNADNTAALALVVDRWVAHRTRVKAASRHDGLHYKHLQLCLRLSANRVLWAVADQLHYKVPCFEDRWRKG